MNQIILGTAGHIDHGKTSLVKTLTGIDTDRLKEEKLRGITIELGFAHLNLPNGKQIGIVDVPGHEKFIKHMVAGATGIDIVVMIIAADEGVMPQTREHMEICSLLGIKHGFIALTKIDMVDEEWLELAKEDIKAFTKNSFLENAPIFPVSSLTGQGINDIVEYLEKISDAIQGRSSDGLFRLPVDRVFTMKGFGTVITGTLISGKVKVGDTIMIYPQLITSKVRGIQVYHQTSDTAYAGARTAINFQGLDKASINRGDVLSFPDALKTTYMIDAVMDYLKSNGKNLKNRTRVRVHTGSIEVLGNIILIDKEEVVPGERVFIQVRLDTPITCLRDDKFVIRGFSPVLTIGGGTILNPIPVKHKRLKQDVIDSFTTLLSGDLTDIILFHIKNSGYDGLSFSDIIIMTNLSEKSLNNITQNLLSKQQITQIDKENRIFLHKETIINLKDLAASYIDSFHKDNPLKTGMIKEELRSKLPSNVTVKFFNLMINQLINEKRIVQEEESVKLCSHSIKLESALSEIKQKILNIYEQNSLTPPYFKDIVNDLKINATKAKDVLMLLIEEGAIIKVQNDLYFSTNAINKLKEELISYLKANNEITMPQFKDMTGISRKYMIPLLEFFDSKNLTMRIGDTRKLRKVF
ncbi:MAG: selenocysteine-specific translation elongation factor [Desulfobacterales bacterium]|nr:selenocysteine-specific translation elongation factor [Desulfobacterales bacterium]